VKKTLFSLLFAIILLPQTEGQIIKTSLTLTILDEIGNQVPGATVTLYETEADYLAEKNKKGIVKFKDLKAIAYFVIARKGDKDNSGKGEQVGKLESNKFNKANIVIE
jgi:hypothetical protein